MNRDEVLDDQALICTDCLMLHAHDDLSSFSFYYGDQGEEREREHRARVAVHLDGVSLTIGWFHEFHSCPEGTDECDCEVFTFRTGTCDSCGQYMAGEYHAATLWRHVRTGRHRDGPRYDVQ